MPIEVVSSVMALMPEFFWTMSMSSCERSASSRHVTIVSTSAAAKRSIRASITFAGQNPAASMATASAPPKTNGVPRGTI